MHSILGETVNWGILDINSVLYWVKGKRHGKWGKTVNQGTRTGDQGMTVQADETSKRIIRFNWCIVQH